MDRCQFFVGVSPNLDFSDVKALLSKEKKDAPKHVICVGLTPVFDSSLPKKLVPLQVVKHVLAHHELAADVKTLPSWTNSKEIKSYYESLSVMTKADVEEGTTTRIE